jgi:hypothetical protein
MVMSNGSAIAPSVFPAEIEWLNVGRLASANLFLRAMVYENDNQRSVRRRILARRVGDPAPSLFAILGFALFGRWI